MFNAVAISLARYSGTLGVSTDLEEQSHHGESVVHLGGPLDGAVDGAVVDQVNLHAVTGRATNL